MTGIVIRIESFSHFFEKNAKDKKYYYTEELL